MRVVFEKDQKVYDQVFFPDKEGMVIKVYKDDVYSVVERVEGSDDYLHYTSDGRYYKSNCKTLSVKPYTAVFQGFEQKEIIPTFEEAERWVIENNACEVVLCKANDLVHYTETENHTTFEALRKLTILRDFHNEGWKPDWFHIVATSEMKYNIIVEANGNIVPKNNYIGRNKVLTFKTSEIRDRFLEEQKELLEIAKPLL